MGRWFKSNRGSHQDKSEHLANLCGWESVRICYLVEIRKRAVGIFDILTSLCVMRLPFYSPFLRLSFSSTLQIPAVHQYHSPMWLEKSIAYAKRLSEPPAEMTETFISADIRSFACLVGEGADKVEFDEFLAATKETATLIEQTPYHVYAGYEDLVACEYAFFKNQLQLAQSHAHSAILKAREKKQHSVVILSEKYLLRIAMQKGDVQLVKSILKQLDTHLDNSEFWNRQVYYDLYTGAFYALIGALNKMPLAYHG